MKARYLDVESWDFLGEPTTTRVRLGKKVTGIVKEMFCYGQCHGLALALHELTEWPVFGIYRPRGALGRYTRHVVVQTPHGPYVDVEGFLDLEDGEAVRTIKDPVRILLSKRTGWLVPNMEFARHYAPIVLEKIHA